MYTALIPIPPQILKEANDRSIENGDLTFGHGIVIALSLVGIILLCVGVIRFKQWLYK